MRDVPAAHRAESRARVRCLVVSVSDTRTLETDTSGQLAAALLAEAGHEVVDRRIVKDEPMQIRTCVERAAGTVDAIILSGGTGLSPRDRTPETLAPLLVKELTGFGELFRNLSFAEIGPAAMLSRAVGGIGPSETLVFALPGSSGAVRLGIETLLGPELGHMVTLMGK